MDNQLLYKIALTKIPTVGPVTARNLVSYCGGISEVFSCSKKTLLKIPGIGSQLAERIGQKDVLKKAEKELRLIEKNEINCFFFLDDDYPDRLKPYQESPVLLYFKGNCNLNHHRIVSIVGTRRPDLQGRLICESLVNELASYDVMIVSGLAYGIDAVAHRTSIMANIPTVGVLGHGLNHLYPNSHKNLSRQMIEQGGMITEFGCNIGPEREHFPMRNRIIAGLCDALIVVQTARKGGSVISAEFANKYNKDVFAVPGRVGDENSKGCNLLIKSHRAALLESVDDLAYVMRWDAEDEQKDKQGTLFQNLSLQEMKLVDLIRNKEEVNIDNLRYSSGLNSSEIASLLLSLEFKGIVKSLPGKRFVLY